METTKNIVKGVGISLLLTVILLIIMLFQQVSEQTGNMPKADPFIW